MRFTWMMAFSSAWVLTALSAAAAADAPEPAVANPIPPPVRSSHGLLEQMSRETQSLYADVQQGVVRLQLPVPKWLSEVAARDNPIDKWAPQLAPQVRAKFEEERDNARAGKYSFMNARLAPTTRPGAETTTDGQTPPPWRFTTDAGSNAVIIESRGAASGSALQIQTGGALANGNLALGGPAILNFQQTANLAANNVGLLFDDAGDVLVPIYLEKETVGDGVPAAIGSDGAAAVLTATFVASDRQTNLTVLKLPTGAGKPVRLASNRPADGSLVLLLQPTGGAAARLMMWTEGQRDIAGLVVSTDGSVSGFARYGQFLSAGACKPVVQQLVRYGKVRRAVLGVTVREVARGDPAREKWPVLGIQPAIRVEDVKTGSAAEKAGMQRGDLVLGVGDDPVGDPSSFAAAIAGRAGPMVLHVLREGRSLDVTVELTPP
jgi:hypothetical protein